MNRLLQLLNVRVLVMLVVILLPTGGSRHFYVDSSRPNDNGDGLTPATAWKTTGKANTGSAGGYLAGDAIYFKRGRVWDNSFLAPPIDGLTYDAYGSGEPPRITYGIYTTFNGSTKSRCTIRNLHLSGITLNGTGPHHVINCVVDGSGGVNAGGAGNVFIYNSNLVGSEGWGIQASNVSTNVIARSCIIMGNRLGGLGIFGGSIDYDYCLVGGNDGWPVENISGPKITVGAHNIYEIDPQWKAWPVGDGYLTITVDDNMNSAHAVDIMNVCNIYSAKMTYFANGAVAMDYTTTSTDIALMQRIIAGGDEIGNHTTVHSPLDLTHYPNLLQMTSTNTSPTVNWDLTPGSSKVVLWCNEPGNRVTLSISSGQTIRNLLTAIGGTTTSPTGKGWTIVRGYRNFVPAYTDWDTPLLAGADSAGAKAAPWTVAVNADNFFAQTINGEATWLAANLKKVGGGAYSTRVIGYPYGANDTKVQNWLLANGYIGARNYNTSCDFLSKVNLFSIGSYRSSSIKDADEQVVRKRARHLYFLSMMKGCGINILTHDDTDLTSTQIGYILDEFTKAGNGITNVTVGQYISAIKADHSTSDNKTYTKNYTSRANYHLGPRSPCINAGDPNVVLATDILGKPRSGTSDIGAYAH